MKQEDAKKALLTLEQYKKYIGFADWHIAIHPRYKQADGFLAEVESDYYEKRLNICLTTGFRKLSVEEQKKVLIHELVHARIEVYQQKCAKLTTDLEEELANDLTMAISMAEDNR